MNDHLTFAQLCNVLDGATVPAATLKHSQRCTGCSDRLDSLRAQAQAMRMLAARQGISPSRAHRGSIMAAAREAGLDCLCKLLRELACACARLDPELSAQASRLQLARLVDRVTPDVRSMGRRLSGLGLIINLDSLPELPLSQAQARDATQHVLLLLDQFQPPARTQELRDALQARSQADPSACLSAGSRPQPAASSLSARRARALATPGAEAPPKSDASPCRAARALDYQPTAAPSLRDSLAPR